MAKQIHELRDGVHGFILFDQLEKRLIDSAPMQRLRCIHQLAMCYQIYPGATHKRFEHSLGVMEVATRIFDGLFRKRLADDVQERIADELLEERIRYWRRVVRVAGMLHDVGHLHLQEFLQQWLEGGKLPHEWPKLMQVTDHEVLAAMRQAFSDASSPLHELATRALGRRHFRTVYELISTHKRKRPTILADLFQGVQDEFGKAQVRVDFMAPASETNDFFVKTDDGGRGKFIAGVWRDCQCSCGGDRADFCTSRHQRKSQTHNRREGQVASSLTVRRKESDMEFKKHAFILAVIRSLRKQGSWTGKTHVNKALSLLRDSGVVPVPFEFVLYKHGPYSFGVEAELEEMQSYGAVAIEPNAQGYGVTLHPGDRAQLVEELHPLSSDECAAIDEVCQFVDARNVAELERRATASWIRTQEGKSKPNEVANRLHALKPHISLADAEKADAEVAKWLNRRN